ncbi:molybdenum cofactor guanylyltransferase MobA [Mangrovicoccus algicola]|uniref:Molybdenum cofactor guanylyltransferase n=1 Tax=Mangrovicoccus algicola TaxID=2771008 RepID=A0A8J6Z0X0_9RHOB|nr:molybdenum cofactor guanylyltransferase MobA [Mangrovicoccus algicola]MBE3639441.1 molybdenum cofactor guanylyltransferase MobA [Mangrovicoccus algicola]
MTTPLGVILAGGQGRRMGGAEKGLLMLGGRCLLDRAIDRLGVQVAGLAVNANGPAECYAEFGLPVLRDTVPGHPGPLAGVLAGLDWAAAQGAERIVTVAVDTPFFPADLAARLERTAGRAGTSIAMAATEEEGRLFRQPVFGLWPVALRGDLRSALGQGVRKARFWADSHGTATALFAAEAFFNINTPADLDRAAAMLPEAEG